jgi:hypothetical protein
MSTIAAGKEVLRLAKEHLKRRESFAVETTLSGKNYLQMMRYARGIDRALRRFSSTSGPKGLRSTWLESPSVFGQVVTTFLRWTFVGAISAVFRICRPPLESLIEFCSSRTPMIWVTSPWVYSVAGRISGFIRCQCGLPNSKRDSPRRQTGSRSSLIHMILLLACSFSRRAGQVQSRSVSGNRYRVAELPPPSYRPLFRAPPSCGRAGARNLPSFRGRSAT